MTVQEFSRRTGLPPTTLRFYDRKQLLTPGRRLDNGYRVYGEEQIAPALLIHSLRLAGVSMKQIQRFMNSEEKERTEWIADWQKDLDSRIALMQSASKYLGGLRTSGSAVYLLNWDEPSVIVWFQHTVTRQLNPFADCIEQDAAIVEGWGCGPVTECFVRVNEARGDRMAGEVGFRFSGKTAASIAPEAVTEQAAPTLFAAIECTADDGTECFRLLRMLEKYRFVPVGRSMNRYVPGDLLSYRLMIPIARGAGL